MGGTLKGVCPSHALTTLYYLARRHGTQADAESAIDKVLQHFEIVSLENSDWQKVRQLPFADFEDAAVAVTADQAGASFIVTRNEADFIHSTVPAITPLPFWVASPWLPDSSQVSASTQWIGWRPSKHRSRMGE